MALKIYPILCRAGKMDNYSYILLDEQTQISAVIDPSEPAPIIQRLNELELSPSFILNTHHHFDHTDGNCELKERYHTQVVANETDKDRIPCFDIGIKDGETFGIGKSVATIIDVSAHTQGHILYYFPNDKALFTGDTLFNLSIGGLFEGSPEQMYAALQKIKALPQNTLFYAGHEYTAYGANQAYNACNGSPEIQNYLQKAQNNLSRNLPAGPYTLKEEIACNPYLRAETLSDFKKLF